MNDVCNIFRWYRSGWGRYTQADPIGLQDGTNLYAYVGANPTAVTADVDRIARNRARHHMDHEALSPNSTRPQHL